LLELGTNTYEAYNAWGGYSLYESASIGARAQIVSFDRPMSTMFFEYDVFLVAWLEKLAAQNGFTVDYATNFDLYIDPEFTRRYRLLVSSAHNEYWSSEEFDAVYRRIFKRGQNTMFLGANTAYWQIRYGDINRAPGATMQGRQLVCFKSMDDPVRERVNVWRGDALATGLFRDGGRLPETMLLGGAYQNYFDADEGRYRYPLFVARNDLPFFRGTGLVTGQSVGDVAGYEWDNVDPEGDGRRLWNAHTSRIPSIPRKSIITILTGSPVDQSGRQGRAESVFFRSKAGAFVFNAGTVRWAWGLAKPGFENEPFKALNRNLFMYLLGRPAANWSPEALPRKDAND